MKRNSLKIWCLVGALCALCACEDDGDVMLSSGGDKTQTGDKTQPDDNTGDKVCAKACVIGTKICTLDGKVMECGDFNSDGCPVWKQTSCPEGAECLNGVCLGADESVSCENECSTANLYECATTSDGRSGTHVCTNTDDDPCLEWSSVTACPDDKNCSQGNCGCQDQCEVGAVECSGTGYRSCVDTNMDGCFEWSSVTPCAGGCSQGACQCDHKCNVGAKECSEDGYRTCVENNDGCRVWSSVTSCPEGCTSGECTCHNECSENAKECSGAGYRICMKNSNGCFKWSDVTPCSQGCDAGACKAAPTVVMAPTRYPGNQILSPITPYVVQSMKNIAAKNSSRKNTRFMKIGDSHMYSGSVFMYCFSNSGNKAGYNLNGNTQLQPVIDEFQSEYNSFSRDSVSAVLGKTAYWAVSGNYITSEISAVNPRFAFFGYGSNDMGWFGYTKPSGSDSGYYGTMQWFYRYILKSVNILLPQGIIPMFIGTGVRTDKPSVANEGLYPIHWVKIFDAISRGVAEAYQVPYMNLQLAQQSLAGYGLGGDGLHHKHIDKGCTFTSDGLQGGANTRNFYAIQMLDHAWRTVVKGENAPDTIVPYDGKGTKSEPYVIASLPYEHSTKSSSGTNNFGSYSCQSGTNESGPEIYYKLTLTKTTKIRAVALSADGVDVDIHLAQALDGSCTVRGDKWVESSLAAGTYYFIVDTYGGSGNAGEYLFAIVECDSDDKYCASSTIGG